MGVLRGISMGMKGELQGNGGGYVREWIGICEGIEREMKWRGWGDVG